MAADSYGPKKQPQYAGSGVPQDAADLSEVADYAALVGNRRAGTSAERGSLPSDEVWPGLEFFETDTNLCWIYASSQSGWLAMPSIQKTVKFTQATNGNGIVFVNHGLGIVPNWAQVILNSGGNSATPPLSKPVIWDNPIVDPNVLQVRIANTTNGSWIGNNSVSGYLTVGV